MDPWMLTVKDVQRLLKISRPEAYRLVNQRGFPAIRFGRAIRVPKDALVHWIEAQLGQRAGEEGRSGHARQ